jgi:NADPH:quinone reductase-like Zn-dependent oxidoreductase
MKHLILTQFGTPSESAALHDDRDPAPGPADVRVRMEAAAVQLAMLPINPATAHVMLNRFVDLNPGDWVGQPGANSAVGRLVIVLAHLRGLKTLNVVRRDVAADEVRAACCSPSMNANRSRLTVRLTAGHRCRRFACTARCLPSLRGTRVK